MCGSRELASRHVKFPNLEDSSMNTPPPSQLELPQFLEQPMPWVRHPSDKTAVPRKVSLLVSVRRCSITQHVLTHSRLKAGFYTPLISPACASMQLPSMRYSQIHLVFH
jgi:hypothetical protein